MGKIFVADLPEGEPVTSFFLARDMQLRQRRSVWAEGDPSRFASQPSIG